MCGIFFTFFNSSIAFKRVHFHCFLLCFRFGATRSTSLHTEGDEFHCYASCDARLEQPRCYSRSRNAANSISRFACRQEIREYCYRRLHWIIIREKRSVTMNKLAVKKKALLRAVFFRVGVFHKQEEIALFSFSFFFFLPQYSERNKQARSDVALPVF